MTENSKSSAPENCGCPEKFKIELPSEIREETRDDLCAACNCSGIQCVDVRELRQKMTPEETQKTFGLDYPPEEGMIIIHKNPDGSSTVHHDPHKNLFGCSKDPDEREIRESHLQSDKERTKQARAEKIVKDKLKQNLLKRSTNTEISGPTAKAINAYAQHFTAASLASNSNRNKKNAA